MKETYSDAIKYNTVTGEMFFLRCDDYDIEINSVMHIKEFAEYFIRTQHVSDEDAFKIRCITDKEMFVKKCENHENGLLVSVCRRPDGEFKWSRWMLAVPEEYSRDCPEVLLYQHNLTQAELDETDVIRVMNDRVYSILKCNYISNHINVIKLHGTTRKYRYRCSVKKFLSDETLDEQLLVHPDDLEEYRKNIKPDQVMDYFKNGYTEKSLLYRRMTGRLYRWVKLRIFPSYECTEEHPAYIFVIEDVHRTVSEFIQNNNMKQALKHAIKINEGKTLVIKTFGNFEISDSEGHPVKFRRKKSRELIAYLVDQYGYPVTTADVVKDVLEKSPEDKTAVKYVSALVKYATEDLEAAGYENVIIREWNSIRINVNKTECDYYSLIEGDISLWEKYHNEYMKEYSWAERTNAELYKQKISE